MSNTSDTSVNIISTSREQERRVIIAAYCDGWISAKFAQSLIDALNLRGA